VFEQRARGTEFLDRPDADPRLVEQSYKFMRVVNRIGGGRRVVRRFLARELSPSVHDTVRVLDIGAADCDIPLALARWAQRRGHRIEFTCLDHDPKAVELAQRKIARSVGWGLPHQGNSGGASPTLPTVQAVQADIFTYQPAEPFDYAIGSMTFHHFTDEEIDRLILRLRGFVRRAVLINDLHRCLLNYIVCFLLALPLDHRIRHDGLLSIRRGFKPQELQRMLAQHDPEAVVHRMWFRRVAGVVRFDRRVHAS
jgi:2-polyprenyl-3-methyl-5-hydroxy-6-metoxy-1,4-benzoquinol methylase